MPNPPTNDADRPFHAARALLLAHRGDLAAATAAFRWPALDHFNWALDWFDDHAAGNDAIALWVVDDDGGEQRVSFAQMAAASSRTANWLRARGVKRGDRMLLMLGNVVPLWEITLAAIKLGAVVSPATTLLSADDLRDRVQRGNMRHVVADAAGAARFADVEGDYTRTLVGAAPLAGWTDYAGAAAAPAEFRPDGVTKANDPLLLYFTSGTTARPKMVLHSHASYPVGHLTTMYWLGLRPGDVHLNISSPGWAKHAWSSFYGPWNAGATVFVLNQARFDPKFTLDTLVRCGITSLCAPPTVWRMLILEDLAKWPVKLTEVIGAGEPLNPEVIERVHGAWGLTLRDGYGQTESTCMVGNPPGLAVRAGSMGQPMPGYGLVLLWAMLLASRTERWWLKGLIGSLLLIPAQAWGISFQWLRDVVLMSGTYGAAYLKWSPLAQNAVAYGYQFGFLMLTPVAPILLWLAFNKRFVAALWLEAALEAKPEARAQAPTRSVD